jgi:hypothetical protein
MNLEAWTGDLEAQNVDLEAENAQLGEQLCVIKEFR